MKRSVYGSPLLLALLLSAVVVLLPGCDLFGADDGARLDGLPGKIVYVAEREGDDGNIYVTDGDGTRRLTDTDESGNDPAFSPDGEQIVYTDGAGATTLGPYLKVMNADGSGKRFLKEYEQGSGIQALFGSQPAWSPDGKRVIYEVCLNCELGGADYALSVVEAAGERYDSTGHYGLTDHPARDQGPAWSPDGEQVAFISNRAYLQTPNQGREDLYVINADGSGLRRLTERGSVGGNVWSPSGEWIATSPEGEALSLVDPESGETKRLQMDLPSDWRAHPIDWPLPDKILLFANSSRSPQQSYRYYLLDTNTGETREVLKEVVGSIKGIPDWFAGGS
ncbi:MAG: hypothetical protein BRD47_07015 [Bacteroidetes bacterium QS_8_68_28]|nr:MAG: hypothetical protein BRD47_07015 [Bacteroidetes bacterium QS_8_68_28]